jgi:hypothetical protein
MDTTTAVNEERPDDTVPLSLARDYERAYGHARPLQTELRPSARVIRSSPPSLGYAEVGRAAGSTLRVG